MSAIDRYLDELGRHLPAWGRRRVLAETEDHLREAARDVGEEEAVARFGDAREVARRFRQPHAVRLAAVAILAALAFPLLAHGAIENALPPAPWPSEGAMPAYLRWKLDAIVLLYVVAVGAGAVAAAFVRRPGAALVVGCTVAVGALVVVTGLATVLYFQWIEAVPGTPGWIPLVAVAQLAAALAAASLLARAARGDPT